MAGLGVEGVLVANEATGVETNVVCVCSHSDGLGTISISVLEVDVVGLEVVAYDIDDRGGV